MISQKSNQFPPTQIKESIGELRVSIARSTAPENKLALTRSRITTLLGILKHKSKEYLMPSLTTLLYDTLNQMIRDLMADPEGKEVLPTLLKLEKYLDEETQRCVSEKSKYYPPESIELLRDYNTVLACRERWKEASKTYMQNHDAWEVSVKMIGDINDILEELELKYDLIVMPKHYTYDVHDLNLFNRPQEQE